MTFYINLLMHTGFFVITIPVFYFEFVTRIVTYALVDNFTDIAKQRIVQTNLNKILKKEQVQPIIDYANIQLNPKVNWANKGFSGTNDEIYNLAYQFCGGISAVCILLSLILCFFYNVSMLEIILENLIVIGFVILSEFLIVTIFLNKLEIIDGDFLHATVLSSIISPSLWECPDGWTSREQCTWGERCKYIEKIFPLNFLLQTFPTLSDYI